MSQSHHIKQLTLYNNNNINCIADLLRIDEDESQGIDHGVGHCEPVEAEVDVFDVLRGHHPWVVVGVQEVGVVGKPADSKNDKHNQNHFDNLKLKKQHFYRMI